jgi:hypothetical protein
MYKFLFILLLFGLSRATASVATVMCGDTTSQGALTASCNNASGNASVNAASMVGNGYPDILDLSVGGYGTSASFTGEYQLFVSSYGPDSASNGWFAPTLTVSNWADVSINLDGLAILPGQGTRLMNFSNGEGEFSISVSGTPGASLEMALYHFWTESGSSITPDYRLVATTLPIPEPGGSFLVGLGLVMIGAWHRSLWSRLGMKRQ